MIELNKNFNLQKGGIKFHNALIQMLNSHRLIINYNGLYKHIYFYLVDADNKIIFSYTLKRSKIYYEKLKKELRENNFQNYGYVIE